MGGDPSDREAAGLIVGIVNVELIDDIIIAGMRVSAFHSPLWEYRDILLTNSQW